MSVTNGADRGAGTLREALFLVATAPGPARITLEVPKISLLTALPPIVNSHGVRIEARQGGSEIDASALSGGGPVLDVAAANVSLDGLTIANCANAAILVRAGRFSLQNATVEACDVGVDVAENADGLLLESNRFVNDRLGVRFAGSSPGTTVASNLFAGEKDAGVWAVRGQPDLAATPINVHDNRFDTDHAGIVAGNLKALIEQNQITGAQSTAIDLVGAGVVVRGNHVSGGSGMGIIADGAHAVVIERNELHGLAAYGIMIRGSSSALVSANRLYECAYGMAFVLGDTRNPSTAVEQHHHRAAVRRHRCHRRCADPAGQPGRHAACFRAARRGLHAPRRLQGGERTVPRPQLVPAAREKHGRRAPRPLIAPVRAA